MGFWEDTSNAKLNLLRDLGRTSHTLKILLDPLSGWDMKPEFLKVK